MKSGFEDWRNGISHKTCIFTKITLIGNLIANVKATCSIVLAQKGGKENVWHAVLSL